MTGGWFSFAASEEFDRPDFLRYLCPGEGEIGKNTVGLQVNQKSLAIAKPTGVLVGVKEVDLSSQVDFDDSSVFGRFDRRGQTAGEDLLLRFSLKKRMGSQLFQHLSQACRSCK